MDVKEQRRKRDREKYAQMTDEEKQEKLKKRREAYQQNKKVKEPKKYAELEPEKRTKICAQERQRYADKQPEQKKARVQQITAHKVLKRGTPCKESIAMMNPAYKATEQEVGTSTVTVRQRKPVSRGERQSLLHRRNEEFLVKQRKTRSVSSEGDTCIMNSENDGMEPLKQPEVMINGNSKI
jgi:hypothetical protein